MVECPPMAIIRQTIPIKEPINEWPSAVSVLTTNDANYRLLFVWKMQNYFVICHTDQRARRKKSPKSCKMYP